MLIAAAVGGALALRDDDEGAETTTGGLIVVPGVVGESPDDASAELEAAGLQVAIEGYLPTSGPPSETPADARLVGLAGEAVREVTGDAPRLPSGPLHDAAEMVPHMPVVMMFAYSSNGLSHCKEEDTPEPYLEKTIEAFLELVEKTVSTV